MIFGKNLEQLQRTNGEIYNKIQEPDFRWDENRAAIETAKNGEPVVVYIQEDGTREYMNSRYNPGKEAEKFMEDTVNLSEKATLVMVGFGNGSHIREFMTKSEKNDTNCIVYEPCKDIFMRIIHDIDISDILMDTRVHIVVHEINDKFAGVFSDIYISSINEKTNKHVSLPKYRKLFPQAYREFVEVLRNTYQDIEVEKNTIDMYGERAAYNCIQNLCYLPGCHSGVEYIGKFPKELPGIVVSAGPSLEKNVELLKKAKGHAMIIVVDTAIKMVMSKGIVPDMVISIDNHKPVHLFEMEGLSKVPFLAEMAVNTEVLELVKPEHLIFYSADSIVWDKLFKEAGSEIRQIYAGGTVAIDAMANLIEWGFQTIIMIGQDLMLTGNKVHAGEGEIEDMSKLPYNVVKVKDIYGNDGYTTADYHIYIREIEKIAERFDVKFVDATEGGALKKNTEIMTLQEALDKYCQNEYDIEKIIQDISVLFTGENSELPLKRMIKMKENLNVMKTALEEGIEACRRGQRLLENKNYDIAQLKEINELLANVDDLYEHFDEGVSVLKCASKGYYEFEDSFYLTEEDHIQESIRMYKKSASYYQSIANAIPKVIDMVEEAIERWHKMYGEKKNNIGDI